MAGRCKGIAFSVLAVVQLLFAVLETVGVSGGVGTFVSPLWLSAPRGRCQKQFGHIAPECTPRASSSPSATCTVAAMAMLVAAIGCKTARRQRQRIVSCAMAPEEESIQRAINSAPSNISKDVQRVDKALDDLPSLPKDAMKKLNGDWKASWSRTYGAKARKTIMQYVHEKLPNTLVNFFNQYYRISDDKVEYVEAFTINGHERVDAAVVFSGPRGKDKNNQVHFQFKTMQVVPQDSLTGESKEMIQSEGLGKFQKPVPINDEATFVELDYISDKMQVHHEEDGTKWVLTSYDKIPFVF